MRGEESIWDDDISYRSATVTFLRCYRTP